jgi:hypothetical protein
MGTTVERFIYFPYAGEWTITRLGRTKEGWEQSLPFPNTDKRVIVVDTEDEAIKTCRTLAFICDCTYERN